ncbi:MAG: FAD-dependent monooxygenase [Pseudomonadota bacterium]
MQKDIVILGSGLSGMIAAIAFAHMGSRVVLLERSNMQFPLDQRTTALTNASKKFLSEIGIWKDLEHCISPIRDIYVLDDKAPQILHFSERESKQEALGYMIENRYLREALEKLIHHPLIDLRLEMNYTVEFEGDKCKILASRFGSEEGGLDVYNPELAVLCEGKNSIIKQQYFTNSIDKSYGQSALTMIVKHEKPHEGTAVEHFMPQGPFAILPLCDPNQSSIVWTEGTELAPIYMKMQKEELTEHLMERFGEFLGKVEIISEMQTFPLSAALVRNYYKGNLVILGDAAHTIHPLAGQGLNQGILDTEELVGLIRRNKAIGLPLDGIVLQEYENKRKLDNYLMYSVTDNLNRFFCNKIPLLRNIRKLGLSVVEKFPKIKKMLVKYATHNT